MPIHAARVLHDEQPAGGHVRPEQGLGGVAVDPLDGVAAAAHELPGSDGTHTGVLAEAVAWAWTRCPHLRADTHEDNHPMRRCLERAGFVYTGTIHVADGTPRRAYERI